MAREDDRLGRDLGGSKEGVSKDLMYKLQGFFFCKRCKLQTRLCGKVEENQALNSELFGNDENGAAVAVVVAESPADGNAGGEYDSEEV